MWLAGPIESERTLDGEMTLGGEMRREAAAARPEEEARDHLRRCLDQQASFQPLAQVQPQAAPSSQAAPRVSLEAEVPEALFDGMRAFLQSRPEWDQYRVITSALAGFLFQNGCSDRCVAQHYLNGLFMRPGD